MRIWINVVEVSFDEVKAALVDFYAKVLSDPKTVREMLSNGTLTRVHCS